MKWVTPRGKGHEQGHRANNQRWVRSQTFDEEGGEGQSSGAVMADYIVLHTPAIQLVSFGFPSSSSTPRLCFCWLLFNEWTTAFFVQIKGLTLRVASFSYMQLKLMCSSFTRTFIAGVLFENFFSEIASICKPAALACSVSVGTWSQQCKITETVFVF